MLGDFKDLLDAIVSNEEAEDALSGHEEVITDPSVLEQLHNLDVVGGDDPPGGRELKDQLDHSEEVDVGVVHGEVDGDQPCATLKPAVGFELCEQGLCHILLKMEVLDVTSTLVRCQFALQTKLMITGSRLANIFRWAYAIQGRKQCLMCLKIMVN